MKFFVTILLIAFVFSGCKKNEDAVTEKACWQLIDFAGNEMSVVCNKTEAELLECFKNGSCGIMVNGSGGDLPKCSYYKVEGEKSCWMVGNVYLENITETGAKHYSNCNYGGVTPVKVNCGYCVMWYHRKKMTNKPATAITYSATKKERFCGDTTKTLFHKRQVIVKDNADSLIVIQFSNNGTDW